MAANFDPSLSHPRDEVRLAVGDIGEVVIDDQGASSANPYLVADETIDALIARYGKDAATGKVARSLASRFSQDPDWLRDEGGGDWRWMSRVKTWQRIADEFDPAPVSVIKTGGNTFAVGSLGVPERRMSPVQSGGGNDSGLRF